MFFLGFSSWSDWRTREVDDRFWLICGVLCGGLTGYELYLLYITSFEAFTSMATLTAASTVLCFLFGLSFFYAGLFGGADAKALWCLGVSVPVYPYAFSNLLPLTRVLLPVFPLTVLLNALITVIPVSLYLALRNTWLLIKGKPLFKGLESESWLRKLALLFIGLKVPASSVKSMKYVFLLERRSPNGGKSLKIFTSSSENTDFNEVGRLAEQLGGDVWVTPALPLIVNITIGYLLALIVGDVPLLIVLRVLQLLRP
ncbi:MAG: A24 family peptidase C-terminal domain-containing protein [Candidatus Nezhaarchaeales archaeon]